MKELFEFLFEKPELRKLTKELHETVLFRDLSHAELDRVIAHARDIKGVRNVVSYVEVKNPA